MRGPSTPFGWRLTSLRRTGGFGWNCDLLTKKFRIKPTTENRRPVCQRSTTNDSFGQRLALLKTGDWRLEPDDWSYGLGLSLSFLQGYSPFHSRASTRPDLSRRKPTLTYNCR